MCAFTALEHRETIHERPGKYFIRLSIPSNLLTEGGYVLGLIVRSYCEAGVT